MNWNIVAVFLAGTVVGVLSQCMQDDHCPQGNTPQCCVAGNLDQLVGVGMCRPKARFGQACGMESTDFKKRFYYCGCEPASLECKVSDPRFESLPNKHRYMRCTFNEEGSGADIRDDDTDDTEVNNGPGGEPPRDDDCEDWEKPC